MPKGVYVRTKPAWNKGLDKSDLRVAKYSEARNITMINRYGSTSYNNAEKRKQTNLDRYGVENVAQSIELNKDKLEKTKQTNLIKYGFEYASQNADVKKKNRNTFIANHPGYSSVSQLPGVGDKISSIVKSDDVKKKKENTFQDRYGVKYGLQNPEIMLKKLSTTLKRYGTLYYLNKEKEYKTKKKNNSFNISNPEKNMYADLCNKYGVDNVETQYMDKRYPFACDFYIPSEDLFIEYNGTWTHGGHPFDETNLDDVHQLDIWKEKAKTSKYYRNAIYTWTKLDVRKQQIAKENNLNYLTIY